MESPSDVGIELDESTVGVWFLDTGERSDFLLALWETVPDKEYRFRYRMRYYSPASKDPFDGKDEKSWYGGRVVDRTRAQAIAGMGTVVRTLAGITAGPMHEVINTGNYEDFLDRFMRLPFVHVKPMPKSKRS